ncbi:MAG: Ig-like domain-containing protein, partial [Ignavibacteriaceae bacterium]
NNSPFVHSRSYWELDKPIVIVEFAMQTNDGTPKEDLFLRLYQFGYAGAMPWSWTDVNLSAPEDMLAGMQYMWDNYRSDVDVNGIAGEWPYITITSPVADSVIADTLEITIVEDAYDYDGYISLVEFFANYSLIGAKDTLPFTYSWTNVSPDHYILKAIAIDTRDIKRFLTWFQYKLGFHL